jgi:hypothetical protein
VHNNLRLAAAGAFGESSAAKRCGVENNREQQSSFSRRRRDRLIFGCGFVVWG